MNEQLLDISEVARLVLCEEAIEKNLTAFYEVGSALLDIRDGRLYRASHNTFEDYCRERWDISRPRAYQFIEAAHVEGNLSTIVDKPTVESQVRELAKVEPAQQPVVWQKAIETAPNGKVTAAHVKQVVSEMAAPEKATVKALWSEIKSEERETRRVERVEKIAEMAKNESPLVSASRYPVLYCDPPWKYDFMNVDAWKVENHYPTLEVEEICALPVEDLATPDAILFMWATAPKLAEAMKVIPAWGFQYKTCAIWDKEWTGMGNYFRIQHELLLIATRGSIPPPHTDNRPASIHREKRSTKHSEKPTEYYGIIEAMYPEFPKIELFARSSREGWASWGNELENGGLIYANG